MTVETRTYLEQWWDELVELRRRGIHRPGPASLLIMAACRSKGAGHPMDPSEPWMRWDLVFNQVAKLVNTPAGPVRK